MNIFGLVGRTILTPTLRYIYVTSNHTEATVTSVMHFDYETA